MRSFFHYAAALALLGVLTSCDEAGASSMAAADFCEAYVETYCDGFESCCANSFATELSVGNCRGLAFQYCEQQLLTVDDRGIAPTGPNAPARILFDFDEVSASAAIERMRSAFAGCVGTARVTFADTHILGEPGSSCLRHEDCFEGTRCEHPPLAIFGTCVFAPLEGQVCSDICAASDLACTEDHGDLICVGPRGEGESCSQAQCKAGLECVDTWDTLGGGTDPRCEARASEPLASEWFCSELTFGGTLPPIVDGEGLPSPQ